MERRKFMTRASGFAGATAFASHGAFAALRSFAADGADEAAISFATNDATYQQHYQGAVDLLAGNIATMPGYPKPVLIEGSVYRGIWLECAPQEGLVYAAIRPDIARNNHTAFFALQREDGQIPASIKTTENGYGQIQMVVPIAATAWELAQQTKDSELIEKAYESSSRWDQWLRRYRDTRHTGLCEGFCTYDTGHDNSPRWKGIPNRCPDADARKCPDLPSMPRLCPDLSATVYGGRIALAAMARVLGNKDADRWLEDAATIRTAILNKLYDAEDAAFYDLDAQDRLVSIRGDLISRVLGEHVVDLKLFETVYQRQIHNPKAFWTEYPLPSIARDDPSFVRPIPRNSWGGASQALTALRAPRWMEHYGKPADLGYLMRQWIAALLRASGFRQQMDPESGVFTNEDPSGYSPAALVFLDFTWRLAGVRKVDDELEWNVRPDFAKGGANFRLRVTPMLTAELKYESGIGRLILNERELYRTKHCVRLKTTVEGRLKSAMGIGAEKTTVVLEEASGKKRTFTIKPNGALSLS